MSGGFYQYMSDGRKGARPHTARDAVAKSLASSGLLSNVNAIARDLSASRIAADSGDVEAMKEANDHIERLKAALDELSTAAPGGKIRFNSAIGEYHVD